jgi:hypothetical protein
LVKNWTYEKFHDAEQSKQARVIQKSNKKVHISNTISEIVFEEGNLTNRSGRGDST